MSSADQTTQDTLMQQYLKAREHELVQRVLDSVAPEDMQRLAARAVEAMGRRLDVELEDKSISYGNTGSQLREVLRKAMADAVSARLAVLFADGAMDAMLREEFSTVLAKTVASMVGSMRLDLSIAKPLRY